MKFDLKRVRQVFLGQIAFPKMENHVCHVYSIRSSTYNIVSLNLRIPTYEHDKF